jgi:hypothetical protein
MEERDGDVEARCGGFIVGRFVCVCFLLHSSTYFRGTQPDFRSVRSESGRLSG